MDIAVFAEHRSTPNQIKITSPNLIENRQANLDTAYFGCLQNYCVRLEINCLCLENYCVGIKFIAYAWKSGKIFLRYATAPNDIQKIWIENTEKIFGLSSQRV